LFRFHSGDQRPSSYWLYASLYTPKPLHPTKTLDKLPLLFLRSCLCIKTYVFKFLVPEKHSILLFYLNVGKLLTKCINLEAFYSSNKLECNNNSARSYCSSICRYLLMLWIYWMLAVLHGEFNWLSGIANINFKNEK
jgi:hypothetical protein